MRLRKESGKTRRTRRLEEAGEIRGSTKLGPRIVRLSENKWAENGVHSLYQRPSSLMGSIARIWPERESKHFTAAPAPSITTYEDRL